MGGLRSLGGNFMPHEAGREIKFQQARARNLA